MTAPATPTPNFTPKTCRCGSQPSNWVQTSRGLTCNLCHCLISGGRLDEVRAEATPLDVLASELAGEYATDRQASALATPTPLDVILHTIHDENDLG